MNSIVFDRRTFSLVQGILQGQSRVSVCVNPMIAATLAKVKPQGHAQTGTKDRMGETKRNANSTNHRSNRRTPAVNYPCRTLPVIAADGKMVMHICPGNGLAAAGPFA